MFPCYRTSCSPVEKLEGDSKVDCYFCAESIKLKNMHDHVGRHILWALRGKDESYKLTHGMQIGVDPCGWCGRDGCKIQLQKKGASHSIPSSCPYQYSKMIYAWATKCTKGSPCTNVPIRCPLCPSGFAVLLQSGNIMSSSILQLITQHYLQFQLNLLNVHHIHGGVSAQRILSSGEWTMRAQTQMALKQ